MTLVVRIVWEVGDHMRNWSVRRTPVGEPIVDLHAALGDERQSLILRIELVEKHAAGLASENTGTLVNAMPVKGGAGVGVCLPPPIFKGNGAEFVAGDGIFQFGWFHDVRIILILEVESKDFLYVFSG